MRVSLRLSLIFLLAGLTALPAFADSANDLRDLYRGARAQAMGNAFVSIADDEEALYYNPAGLAGVRWPTLQYMNLQLESSTDVVSSVQDSVSTFKNISGDALNILMGKDLYIHASYAPTLVMPHFGIGILTDQQLSLITKNKALPVVNLGYQTTNGIQTGFGFTVAGSRKSRSEIRLGVGLKMLFRRGGYYDLTQTQIINMSQDELKKIVGGFGTGVGWDLGTQYLYHASSRFTVTAGASYMNVGGISFGDDAQTSPVNGNFSLGLSGRYRLGLISATLAYDCQHILDSVDPRLRNHFGAELSLPLFQFYAGINQVYPTLGLGLNLWLIKVMAVTYGEEMSALAHTDHERRYLLQISMGL